MMFSPVSQLSMFRSQNSKLPWFQPFSLCLHNDFSEILNRQHFSLPPRHLVNSLPQNVSHMCFQVTLTKSVFQEWIKTQDSKSWTLLSTTMSGKQPHLSWNPLRHIIWNFSPYKSQLCLK